MQRLHGVENALEALLTSSITRDTGEEDISKPVGDAAASQSHHASVAGPSEALPSKPKSPISRDDGRRHCLKVQPTAT